MNAVEEVFDEIKWEQMLTEHESRPVTLPDDPVALACASYREYQVNRGERWRDLASCKASDDDRVRAQQIRQYYKNRILMRQLSKGAELSTFQQRLYEILSNSDALTAKDQGILHRLNYFYDEDTQRDRLKEQMPGISQNHRTGLFNHNLEIRRLRYVARIFRSRRHSEIYEYWWQDQNDEPVMLAVAANNPLLSMIHGLSQSAELKMRGLYRPMIRTYIDEYSFWNIVSPEIAVG